jgi:glyoxylase-like metal-dependent hydrolase (beta-lactamase superfamily II)
VSAEKGRLELKRREVGPWGTNAYSLICRGTGQSLLIDPAGEPAALREMLDGSELAGILITHGHMDHVGALGEMREAPAVPVLAHQDTGGVEADRWLQDGDVVQIGQHTVRVRHAPGHTGGSVCYSLEGDNRVLVGDAIFEGGPGHTSSAEAFRLTLRTLRETILAWPDDTVCYPGHGPSFRLGDKRAAIEAFLEKDHGDFCGDATWEM